MTERGKGVRYEFRCWPDDITDHTAKLDRLFPESSFEERVDTYFLPSIKENLLPKIRGQTAFEIKRRLEIIPPLELWELFIREPFPIPRVKVCRILHILKEFDAAPKNLRDCNAAIEYFSPWLVMRRVPKSRKIYVDGVCRAEATRAIVDLRAYMSIAFEGRDPGALRMRIQTLGLSALPNKHYGQKLRELMKQPETEP